MLARALRPNVHAQAASRGVRSGRAPGLPCTAMRDICDREVHSCVPCSVPHGMSLSVLKRMEASPLVHPASRLPMHIAFMSVYTTMCTIHACLRKDLG